MSRFIIQTFFEGTVQCCLCSEFIINVKYFHEEFVQLCEWKVSVKIAFDDTRMQSIGSNGALGSESFGEFASEQYVGQFALSVSLKWFVRLVSQIDVFEVNFAHNVCHR